MPLPYSDIGIESSRRKKSNSLLIKILKEELQKLKKENDNFELHDALCSDPTDFDTGIDNSDEDEAHLVESPAHVVTSVVAPAVVPAVAAAVALAGASKNIPAALRSRVVAPAVVPVVATAGANANNPASVAPAVAAAGASVFEPTVEFVAGCMWSAKKWDTDQCKEAQAAAGQQSIPMGALSKIIDEATIDFKLTESQAISKAAIKSQVNRSKKEKQSDQEVTVKVELKKAKAWITDQCKEAQAAAGQLPAVHSGKSLTKVKKNSSCLRVKS